MSVPGNKNATKNRRWSQAIDKALKQYNEGEVQAGHALDKIAYRLVHRAIAGDDRDFDQSIREIGDRIDGKSVAVTELQGTGSFIIEIVK